MARICASCAAASIWLLVLAMLAAAAVSLATARRCLLASLPGMSAAGPGRTGARSSGLSLPATPP
eukprot:151972-Heterocapsa_arctica.AAC.1